MINDTIYDTLENELSRQGALLEKAQTELLNAPPGFLYIRNTGKQNSYYHIIKQNGCELSRTKVSNDEQLRQLLKKAENKTLTRICANNKRILRRALKDYIPLNMDQLLSEKQRQLFLDLHLSAPPAPYKKAPFNPARHIHETVCGELVSSKGEVIIVNALWHYGIPFNYEELFPYLGDDGNKIYPDFTIHCPDGTTIIWEHWGLLDRQEYCERNVTKLHAFHTHHFTIGKNLIITQDDIDGNCSTALIYHIIENYILPHFR